MFRRALTVVLATALSAPSLARAQRVQHPMDPLSWQEMWTVLEVLTETRHLNDSTRFSLVTLQEPPKSTVWQWTSGQAFPRSALAVVRQGPRAFEAVVDLTGRRLARWTELKDVQPNYLEEELFGAGDILKGNPEWQAAMKKRGITEYSFIDCVALPPGYFPQQGWEGKRIARVTCIDARRVRNTWARAIENLTTVVDLNTRQVLKVIDDGPVAIPTGSADYDEAAVGPLRAPSTPIALSQPLGPGFRMDGNVVTWQNWSFHVRVDQRVGTVISTVRYQDGARSRPVLYQGSLSEVFVPYMDPSMPWFANNFLDAGEYSFGGFAKSLSPGLDCPDNAVYLDAVMPRDNGRPKVVQRSACLFERYAGDVAWRHLEDVTEGRPKRDLVVRMIAVLGNYDYVFDWVFQQDGSIRVAVGATGITEVKMTTARNATVAADATGDASGSAERADAYGRFVMDNVVAVNHDHYFNFRLDLDVDGADNSFQKDQLKTVRLAGDHPRKSIWVREESIARTESDGKLRMDMEHPSLWRVVNPKSTNRVGYAVSYQLQPSMNIMTLLSPDDTPRRRAGFIENHLWVTPYEPNERYAAGMYPTLSKPGEGLPRWTSANRAIANTDIVLWYTFGMHHVVRGEDWPVMPVAWNGFELRPFDFFDRNPALDLQKKP